jgi:hypothetical protein
MGQKAHEWKAEIKNVLVRPKKAHKSFLKAHRINFWANIRYFLEKKFSVVLMKSFKGPKST